MIDPTRAYVMRNDGKIIDCGRIHPYIMYHQNSSIADNIEIVIDKYDNFLKFFFDNTQYQNTKDKIREAIQYLCSIVSAIKDEDEIFRIVGISDVKSLISLAKYVGVKDIFDIDVVNDDVIATLTAKFTEANFMTNQEFLRFRMGSMYTYSGNRGDIYFRVSSIDFDWFPLIEKFVIDNKSYIETVTISYDEQSGRIGRGGNKFYILDGKKMLGISVDEFISLGGRPVVEGKELFEMFGDFGAFHNVNIFDVKRKRYVLENFS